MARDKKNLIKYEKELSISDILDILEKKNIYHENSLFLIEEFIKMLVIKNKVSIAEMKGLLDMVNEDLWELYSELEVDYEKND